MSTLSGGSIVWDLEANTSQLDRGLSEASKMVDRTAENIRNRFSKVSADIGQFGKDMSIAVTAPVTALGLTAFKFTELGGKYSSVEDSFRSMTEGMGVDAKKFQADVAAATGGQIDNLTILQGATRGLSLIGKEAFNDFGQDFVKMAELAKKSARATGQDVDFMFDSLVLGISRESKMILDNLGVSIDITKAKEEYAKSLGKTVTQLTQSEQKHAVLNTTLAQLEDIYGNVAVSAGGFSGAFQKLQTTLTNARIEIGQKLEPSMAELTKSMEKLASELIPKIVAVLTTLVNGWNSLGVETQQIIVGIVALLTVLGPVILVINVWIGAIVGVIGVFGKLIPLAQILIGVIFSISAPVWIVIGVITALIAIGVLLWNNWDWIKEQAINVFRIITEVFQEFTNSLANNINFIIQRGKDMASGMINAVSFMVSSVISLFSRLWSTINSEVSSWPGKLYNWGVRMIQSMADGIRSAIGSIASAIKDALESAKRFIESRSPPIAGPFKDIDKWGYNLGNVYADSIKEGFSSNFDGLKGVSVDSDYDSSPSSQSITVNVGQINDEQDLDMLAREIGFRLALAPGT